MAHLSKINGQHRLRYRITFPDGTYTDRSRRYRTRQLAQGRWPVAHELEEKTRYQRYTSRDIERWRRERLINKKDIQKLGFFADIKTLGQAIEEYEHSWDISAKEAASREARLKNILAILGDTYLKNLRYGDGLRFRTELKARGYKVATIQKYVQDLKRCFNLQVANQAIEFNPFASLGAGRIPQKERITHKALTDAEVGEVVIRAEGSPVLGSWLKIFLLMFFGCGVRRKEALTARWEKVNWDERSLVVMGKTGKERKVGLGQRLFYELLLRKKEEGSIFPRFYPDSVSKAIQKHLKACGHKMRLHDTRHTYVTLIQQKAGVQPIDAMQRTGHQDMRMLSLYSHGKFGKIYEDEFGFMKVNEGQESEA